MANILIVEDEAIIAMESKMNLLSIGHEVKAIVSTAEEAILSYHRLSPDLIIMDITLDGEMDGLDALKEIRKHSNVPAIFITGNSDAKTRSKINELSNIAYLQKPILTKDLITEVEKMLPQSVV